MRAFVVDRAWNVLQINRVAPKLFGLLGLDDAMWQRVGGEGPRNLLKQTLHADGVRPYLANLAASLRPHRA